MRDVTTLETPPGILAVARKASQEPKQAPAGTAIFANSIRDPGNLGTLIRSAEAAGCEFLACSHDTVDPYSPKVLRASMGSIFRVSVFKVPDTKSYLESLRTIGVAVYALSPHKGINLFAFRTKRPFVLIVGGETAGMPSEYEPDGFLKIPMSDKVESLNAAVAGSIAIFVLSNPQT
jgi:TrmH family RNA methyltransferase